MTPENEFRNSSAIESRGDGERAEKLIDFANVLGWRVHSYDLRDSAQGDATLFTVSLYRGATDAEPIQQREAKTMVFPISTAPAAESEEQIQAGFSTPEIDVIKETLEAVERSKVCDHRPAIMHRTGGPPAHLKNACSECGRFITRTEGGPWKIDADREAAAWEASNANQG